jgi:hypothetical protein
VKLATRVGHMEIPFQELGHSHVLFGRFDHGRMPSQMSPRRPFGLSVPPHRARPRCGRG